ncbi:DUF2283 domain-containing protein [Candidatus Woesearchaeota archaeon]|nr:DUF2283 domain-containing protein [Candidatus Woesearchaeota archaeon]
MANLGLEERIADRAATAAANYNTFTSNYLNYNLTHTSNYALDSYSHRISFGNYGAAGKKETQQTIITNTETQTDNILAGLENIAIAYSPVYDVETKHHVPDASFSFNGDEIYLFPEQCGNGTNYMIFRPTENVGEPMELEEGFYYAHADELDGIEQALQSMQDIKTEMIKFEASGQLERLIEFAQENGTNTYILRQPDFYGATSKGLAIAYTFYHKHIPGELFLLGAGKNFYDSTYNHGLNFGVHPDYGIVDALTEELLHQVQPEWMYDMVIEHGYMELLEGHVKALKSKYFFERVNEAPDEDTRMSYWLLSLNNYAWYRQLMKQHIELYGVEIDEDIVIDIDKSNNLIGLEIFYAYDFFKAMDKQFPKAILEETKEVNLDFKNYRNYLIIKLLIPYNKKIIEEKLPLIPVRKYESPILKYV